jgi:phage shock protein B
MFGILEDVVIPIVAIGSIFVAAPWIILHYVTRWKTLATLTKEDENLLDDLYELSRRLEERVTTVERILTADNPGWRTLSVDPASIGIEDEISAKRSIK